MNESLPGNRTAARGCIALAIAVCCALSLPAFAASSDATLSGVVRDVHGTPQMGALVRLVTADATIVASALTDTHGRYMIAAVYPGSYQLRATAAFLVPASKSNVRLRAGAQAIVNLTMSTLYDAASWLPARARRSDEPADDWKWTLRSAANRPLLRLTEPTDETGVVFSSSAEQQHHASTRARLAVTGGDAGFGGGGVHKVLIVDRSVESGDSAILRADLGGSRSPYPVAPAAEVMAGYERRSPLGGATRLVVTVQSHPELAAGLGAGAGAQIFQLASTQEFHLGDLLALDTGTLLRGERMQGSHLSASPFVRIEAHPTSDMLVEYRYASSPDLQSSADLDRLKPALRTLSDPTGRPLSVKGGQHSVSLTRRLGTRTLQASLYTNHLDHAALGGSGLLTRADMAAAPLIADPTTATFFFAADRLNGQGLSASLAQPLTQSLAVWMSGDLGTALVASSGGVATLASPAGLRRTTYAAGAEVRGKVVRTGTSVRAGYHYQPGRSLTAVNAFAADPAESYLGFAIRQRIVACRFLPSGLDAVIEATNLLGQGYQPVMAADGHVVFLTQAPRSIQGGFALNF